MELTIKEITDGNQKIAKFLGWYQHDELSFLYYKDDETGKRVVFDIRSVHQDLPFHRDWKYLMEVVEFLEDEIGACITSTNYSKLKNVKINLHSHIGFDLGNEDYYCDISASTMGENEMRYFQIQRIDESRMISIFRTIVMFIDAYDDKTIRIINVSNNEVTRIENFK